MKFWIILGVVVLIIVIIGFVFLSSLHSDTGFTPAEQHAALNHALGHVAQLTPTDHSTWNTYTSKFVSFSYPGWATIYTQDNEAAKKQKNILDSFHFELADMHINGIVSVISRPDFSQINEESGVQLRIHDTSYQVVGTISATRAGFTNTTLGEQSLFLLKNGRVYSLLLTGGVDDDRNTIFQKMLATLVEK
jgi:hypothetical protein